MARQRQLHQNAIDGGVGIKDVDLSEQLVLGYNFRKRVRNALDARLCTGLRLSANIRSGCWVTSNQYYGKGRCRVAFRRPTGDFIADFLANVLGDGAAIYDCRCRHGGSE